MADDVGAERLFGVGEVAQEPLVSVVAGRSKTFRSYDQGQSFLLPVVPRKWRVGADQGRCRHP